MGFGAFSNSTPTRLCCKSTWFFEHNHFGHEVYVLNSQINHPQKIRCTKSLSFTCTQMKGKTIYDDFQYISKVLVSRYPCHLITIGKGYGLHTSYYRLLNLKMQATWKSLLKWKRKQLDHQYYEYWLLAERIQQFQYIQQFEPSSKLWYECY